MGMLTFPDWAWDAVTKGWRRVTTKSQQVWRLLREDLWPGASARSLQGWRWLMPRWRVIAFVVLIVVLIIVLVAEASTVWSWVKDKEIREAVTPLLTFATALAAGVFALMRHFQTIAADRRRRITESFSKAVSQLASDKLEERLGGIYTFEKISNESSDDYWTVMENLTAFVRERTQRTAANPEQRRTQRIAGRAHGLWEKAGRPEGRSDEFWREAVEQEPPEADIAAVLTVIKRRSEHHRVIEGRDKKVLDFREAFLRSADLRGVHLEGALLVQAHLEGADLVEAHLEGADLIGAHLEGADLSSAEGLTQAQVHMAFGDAETKLPKGLTRPARWTDPTAPRPDVPARAGPRFVDLRSWRR